MRFAGSIDDEGQAALIKAFAAARINLQQHLTASEQTGQFERQRRQQ